MYENDMVSDSEYFADPALIIEMSESDDFDDDTTQEEINMTAKKATQGETKTSAIDGLHMLLGNLTQFPQQNVLQRMMQSMVTEIARARHMADRIEMGDEPLMDMSGDQRPGIDQDRYERTLSERQLEILVNCQNDEAELIAALVETKSYYVWLYSDEKVTYAIADNGRGGWTQITDFNQAVDAEYRKAHQNWVKRQHQATQQGFTPEGAQEVRRAAADRAKKLAKGL